MEHDKRGTSQRLVSGIENYYLSSSSSNIEFNLLFFRVTDLIFRNYRNSKIINLILYFHFQLISLYRSSFLHFRSLSRSFRPSFTHLRLIL